MQVTWPPWIQSLAPEMAGAPLGSTRQGVEPRPDRLGTRLSTQFFFSDRLRIPFSLHCGNTVAWSRGALMGIWPSSAPEGPSVVIFPLRLPMGRESRWRRGTSEHYSAVGVHHQATALNEAPFPSGATTPAPRATAVLIVPAPAHLTTTSLPFQTGRGRAIADDEHHGDPLIPP